MNQLNKQSIISDGCNLGPYCNITIQNITLHTLEVLIFIRSSEQFT